MQTDLFGNPLPPQPAATPAEKHPKCGECLYCKEDGPRHLCRCPSSWGGIGFSYLVNPAYPACADYKPARPRRA